MLLTTMLVQTAASSVVCGCHSELTDLGDMWLREAQRSYLVDMAHATDCRVSAGEYAVYRSGVRLA